MKVLIVSSGIGPWPNDGWGAIENHSADFAWALENQGLEVKVFHDSDTIGKLPEVVSDWKPDLIHLEYDDHVIALIPILREYPNTRILITTQYAFLSQPYKLVQDGYMLRFLLTCDIAKLQNVFLAVVSDDVGNTYKKLGNVPESKIWLSPNGSRVDLIHFYSQPIFPKKAICIGKIETRKNQAELQSCELIDFVGPVTDDRFDIHKNYIGKWNRQELYHQVGKYACLVLISKGEAHPLVIGEALSAGLAILCNDISSPNLPLDKPWISVVPDSILKNPKELHKAVEKMCEIGVQYRAEIRKWAEENLDYRVKTKRYCEKWNLVPTTLVKTLIPDIPDVNVRFITLNSLDSKNYIPPITNLW